jgi:hypothetical protein
MRALSAARVSCLAAGLALLWSGWAAASAGASGWSVQPTPNVRPSPRVPRGGELGAVSCSAPSDCIAVGNSGYGHSFAVRWNRTRWKIRPLPGRSNNALAAVSCSSPRMCTAVGYQLDPDRTRSPLVERWNGRGWTIEHAPGPADSELVSVSCTLASACTAVGSYENNSHTLAEHWNGQQWAIHPTPTPGLGGSLHSVSCASARACTAVGTYSNGRKGFTLIERWNGHRWRVQPSPNPPTVGDDYKSPAESELLAVSCSSTSACTAVGGYTPAIYTNDPLVERWNGRGWTITPTPAPGNRGAMYAVSCSSVSACTAVGVSNSDGDGETAERWNGHSWTIQHMPNPKPMTYNGSRLSGVSCPSRSVCVAVGRDIYPQTGTTLAERWTG